MNQRIFGHIFLYRATHDEIDRCNRLVTNLNSIYEKKIDCSVIAEHQLEEAAQVGNFLVTGAQLKSEDQDFLWQHGVLQYVTVKGFLEFFPVWQKFRLPAHHNRIVLIYLHPKTQQAFKKLFSFYGYDSIVCQNWNDMEIAFSSPVCFAVFDADISSVEADETSQKKIRDKTIQFLKSKLNSDVGFSVVTLKDFDSGSIFETIGGKIKEISNVMLSEVELVLFLYDYLQRYGYGRLAVDTEKILEKNNYKALYLESKTEMSIALRNAKKVYQRLQKEPFEVSNLEKKIQKLEYLSFVQQSFKESLHYLKNQLEENNRNAFLFNSES